MLKKKKSLLIAVLKDVFLNYIEITKAEVKWGVGGSPSLPRSQSSLVETSLSKTSWSTELSRRPEAGEKAENILPSNWLLEGYPGSSRGHRQENCLIGKHMPRQAEHGPNFFLNC